MTGTRIPTGIELRAVGNVCLRRRTGTDRRPTPDQLRAAPHVRRAAELAAADPIGRRAGHRTKA